MPNAKDFESAKPPIFLVLGKTGSGKTASMLTLPGKKFSYCFDANAVLTLQGHDVDYEEFLPADLSLRLTSLSKDTMKKMKSSDMPRRDAGADLYRRWEDDFEQRLNDGFFNQYDVISLDGCTTLLDMIMDGILAINGRAGQWPNQDDYGPQMLTFTNVMRTIVSMGKMVWVTGHIETRIDEVTKRMLNFPIMTGKLRSKIPLLFSEVLVMSADTDQKGNTAFLVQTRPDRLNDSIRCTAKNTTFKEDITIDWNKPVEGQGIWRLYK